MRDGDTSDGDTSDDREPPPTVEYETPVEWRRRKDLPAGDPLFDERYQRRLGRLARLDGCMTAVAVAAVAAIVGLALLALAAAL